MNMKPIVALSALVLTTWLFASNAPAGPHGAAMTTRVTPPSSEQQTTSDGGNVHGGGGVATPNGGPGGGDRCRGPRCRRLPIKLPPIGSGSGGGGSGNGDVPWPTPHECYTSCMEAVGNADRCIDDCYKS